MTPTDDDVQAPRGPVPGPLHPVVLIGLLLVAAQVGVRAWASFGSWFYGDDYNLMSRLYAAPLTLGELFTPHDSQLMPGGIFLAWVMSNAGPQDWTVGATILVVSQSVASLCCLLMLVTVFGRRWAILPLLLVYLFSPLTLTAYMWWAAAINQVPLQASFFLTATAAVLYFRTRRTLWLVLTVAAVVLGMAFYVKAALFLPVVAAIAFLFFSPTSSDSTPGWRGSLSRLVRSARGTLRAFGPMWATMVVLGGAYVALYSTTTGNPLSGYDLAWGSLADNFFRVSLGPGLVGGPWRWWNPIPPTGLVDPPTWAVTATWIAVALAAYRLQQRGGVRWRALVVLAGYLVAIFLLLGLGRAVIVGSVSALELRYLADATPVVVLTLGLLLLDVRTPHDSPATLSLDRVRSPGVLVPVLMTAMLLAGAGVSTVRYVALWHADYDGKTYTRNVAASAQLHDIRVAAGFVPEDVVSPLRFPDNAIARVFRQFPNVRVLSEGNDLSMIDEVGLVHPADVEPGLVSRRGPKAGCGYPVDAEPTTIELRTSARAGDVGDSWWVAIDYIGGSDTVLGLRVGDVDRDVQALSGLHRFLVQGTGPVRSATLRVEASDVALCVEQIRVGKVQEWQPTQQ
ncbi:hypothetical protein [Nocardioides currus]|uniref:hypothetical protein n=1 Tax=Nocardioides currus TaxID=2133958 RepID=UPI0014034D8B|nr:hypothetical protein [Nocardioides currus]